MSTDLGSLAREEQTRPKLIASLQCTMKGRPVGTEAGPASSTAWPRFNKFGRGSKFRAGENRVKFCQIIVEIGWIWWKPDQIASLDHAKSAEFSQNLAEFVNPACWLMLYGAVLISELSQIWTGVMHDSKLNKSKASKTNDTSTSCSDFSEGWDLPA